MLRLLLVRHADPINPMVHQNEYTRPLTTDGERDAVKLAENLNHLPIDAVYSSPYRRAIQTVEPIAQARGLDVRAIEELREHALALEPIPDWKEVLERAWTDFDFALPGAETMRATQARGLGALETIRAKHPTGTVAVGGHGTIFSLMLHAFEPRVDCAFHLSMPMPAVYALEFHGSWRVVSGSGF
jgi:2,3-bisphosphoglycerate-dependent phosphoglycerate mutase